MLDNERDPVDAEIDLYLDERTAELMAGGLDETEARRVAVRRFGDRARIRRACLRQRRGPALRMALEALSMDLRASARGLRRSPGWASVVLLTVALLTAGNTALLGTLRTVLVAPLPWDNTERLVTIWSSWTGAARTWISAPEFHLYRAQVPAFEDIALLQVSQAIAGDPATATRVRRSAITPNFFHVAGARVALGREFVEADAATGDGAAIISWDYWQSEFRGDSGVIGSALRIGERIHTITGVLPAGFRSPFDFGEDGPTVLYTPMRMPDPPSEYPGSGGSHQFHALGLLRDGASVDDARAQLDGALAPLRAASIYPESLQFRALAVPAREEALGPVRGPLLALTLATVVLTLIAVANLISMALGRHETRSHEFGVRLALGESRTRMVTGLLLETAGLAAAGWALGFVGSRWLLQWIAGEWASLLPRAEYARMDTTLLLASTAPVLLTLTAIALGPGIRRVGHQGFQGLSSGRTSSRGRNVARARTTLVVSQIAAATMLVVMAAMMIQTIAVLSQVNTGFRIGRQLTFRLGLPASRYQTTESVTRFYEELLADITALPGVSAAGAARALPVGAFVGTASIHIEGRERAPGEQTAGERQIVTPGYFEALGIRLLAGRLFTSSDRDSSPQVALVSRSLAELYWPGEDPIGRIVRTGSETSVPVTVVGVVDDVSQNGLTSRGRPQWYRPHAQIARSYGTPERTMTIVVDGSDPVVLADAVRRIVASRDPELAVWDTRTMEEVVSRFLHGRRLIRGLLAGFAATALILTAVGVNGVTAWSVTRRRREFGIRMSLGATGRRVLGSVLLDAIRRFTIGAALGLALGFGAGRIMQSLLQDARPGDPAIVATATGLMFVVVIASSLRPAWRAASTPPGSVLQGD